MEKEEYLTKYDEDLVFEGSENLDILESQLNAELEEQLGELSGLEIDFEQIGSPDALGETVKNVVWEQFINQVGVVAGEDFIKENRGLKLDLRDSAHIQTADNFAKGKIATHNYKSAEQLAKNYDRYKNTQHGQFRKQYVDPGMDATLPRAGVLNKQGQETVKDIYTGRQIPTQTKLDDGSNNPLAAQREHVKSSAELYKNPSLQMANNNQELADIINNPENLQGYTTAERNNRKSDHSQDTMDPYDKNRHWEKANERADKFIKEKEKEGEVRLKQEGRQTQKAEAFRIGKTALRAAIMGLLAELMKNIIKRLIKWFKSAEKKLGTLIEHLKEAIHDFIHNLRQNILTTGNTVFTSIFTAIFGPIVGLIKKAWIFLKQGYNSLKSAIQYIKDPQNKGKSISLLMMEVGKILIAGVTAGGAILLGEVIEKGLLTIPIFAVQIPLLGSLANILGIFFGAVAAGIIGAIALNLIDKAIANKTKRMNIGERLEIENKILETQTKLVKVVQIKEQLSEDRAITSIQRRHEQFGEAVEETAHQMKDSVDNINSIHEKNNNDFDNLQDLLNNI